ncbi:MAG: AAA family ATPase, partial [Patescibacteria group bacterium]
KQEIKGQDAALQFVGEAFEIHWAGLKYPDEPIFVLMCLGPSGVGKTLLAEMIAKYFFNNRNGLTKIECGSFSERHEYARLIGSPPGYIGHDEEPLLSQWNINKHNYDFIMDSKGYKELLEKERRLRKDIFFINRKLSELNEKRINEFAPNKGVTQREGYRELMKEISALETKKINLEIKLQGLNKRVEDIEKKSSDIVYSDDKDYFSVILFDEIEKASESVRNLMLEITDKGRLTLGNGRITNFQNSFIIITSNLGSRDIGNLLSGGGSHLGFMKSSSKLPSVEAEGKNEEITECGLNALREAFSPEFIGRLDGVVVFQPLNKEMLFSVLDLKITELAVFLSEKGKPLSLEVDPKLKEHFVQQAAQYREEGARFLRKQLRNHILLNIARLFNTDKLYPGAALVVKYENGQIRFYIDTSGSKEAAIVKVAE